MVIKITDLKNVTFDFSVFFNFGDHSHTELKKLGKSKNMPNTFGGSDTGLVDSDKFYGKMSKTFDSVTCLEYGFTQIAFSQSQNRDLMKIIQKLINNKQDLLMKANMKTVTFNNMVETLEHDGVYPEKPIDPIELYIKCRDLEHFLLLLKANQIMMDAGVYSNYAIREDCRIRNGYGYVDIKLVKQRKLYNNAVKKEKKAKREKDKFTKKCESLIYYEPYENRIITDTPIMTKLRCKFHVDGRRDTLFIVFNKNETENKKKYTAMIHYGGIKGKEKKLDWSCAIYYYNKYRNSSTPI